MSRTLTVRFSLKGLDLKRTDFDKKEFRRQIAPIGRVIRKDARDNVRQMRVSSKGQYPGKTSGNLQRAIKLKMFRSGYGMVVFQDTPQNKDTKEKKAFYPAFLRYGTVNRVNKKGKSSGRVEKRENYVQDALMKHKGEVERVFHGALESTLKGLFE